MVCQDRLGTNARKLNFIPPPPPATFRPADGYPVVGFVPGTKGQVYVAMSHSGITLASLWGALASAEIGAQPAPLGRSEPLSETIPALLR
jgi:glycine/D-amino acid oxidase-like deaminating enzyme